MKGNGVVAYGVKSAADAQRFTLRQAFIGIAVVVVLVSSVAIFAFEGKPSQATSTIPVGGSLVLDSATAPVVVDLASGSPTVQLQNVGAYVGLTSPGHIQAVNLTGSTLLVNDQSGTFNYLGSNGLIIDTAGSGIPVNQKFKFTSAIGIGTGSNAYLVQSGASNSTISYLNGETLSTGDPALGRTGEPDVNRAAVRGQF